MTQYEAMFLFDPTFGNSFEKCEAEIRRLMDRAEAQIILCRKWDERRLAYRIKKRKRGVYVLVYFKAPPDKIAPLERDAKLSEHILRVLVLRAEHLSREGMERAFTTWSEERAKTDSTGLKAAAPSEKAPEDQGQAVKSVSAQEESGPVVAEAGVAEGPSDQPITDG